jgi:hypothetical protein
LTISAVRLNVPCVARIVTSCAPESVAVQAESGGTVLVVDDVPVVDVAKPAASGTHLRTSTTWTVRPAGTVHACATGILVVDVEDVVVVDVDVVVAQAARLATHDGGGVVVVVVDVEVVVVVLRNPRDREL